MRMHPALRILGVFLFIPLMAHAQVAALVAGCALAGLGLCLAGREALSRFGTMVLRLKWFFLSICLLFLWFTPGSPLLPALGGLSPVQEGLREGLGRCLVLVLAVAAVVWLLQVTPREQLLGGLLWLTRPLRALGFPQERFAVRLVLTLEVIPQLRLLLGDGIRSAPPGPGLRARAAALGDGAARLFSNVLDQADRRPLEPMTLEFMTAPSMMDWMILSLIMLPLLWLAM